jgi:hypothetical protein
MGSQSHTSGGGRERYERIATMANEVAQAVIALAQGAPTPLDLVVQNITALIDDAVALGASTPPSPRLLPAPLPMPAKRDATAIPSPPLASAIRQIATLDKQIATRRSGFGDAISDAKQACKALAAVGGHPDLSLLLEITAALRRISTCSQTLGQLVHDRTLAVSSLADLPHVDSPIDDSRVVGPVGRTTREALASQRSVTSFISPPAPAPRHLDDELRRGPRITGPTAF